MMRRLFAVGMCVAIALVLSATSSSAQKKEGAKKQDRVEGNVQSFDKAKNTLTVRLRGKENTVQVMFTDKTAFTFRNKPSSMAEVKDGRHVICLGRLDKGVLTATRIDVRDETP